MSCGELLIVANPADVQDVRIEGRFMDHLFVHRVSVTIFLKRVRSLFAHVVEGDPVILIRPTFLDCSSALV